jgi:hypothetical protein
VCPDGSYYDPVSDQCKYCFLCHPGRGAVTKCGSTNNTVCGECGNGTYSNKLDSFSKCTPCTICKETEVALKECTPSEDRICFSKYKKCYKIISRVHKMSLYPVYFIFRYDTFHAYKTISCGRQV